MGGLSFYETYETPGTPEDAFDLAMLRYYQLENDPHGTFEASLGTTRSQYLDFWDEMIGDELRASEATTVPQTDDEKNAYLDSLGLVATPDTEPIDLARILAGLPGSDFGWITTTYLKRRVEPKQWRTEQAAKAKKGKKKAAKKTKAVKKKAGKSSAKATARKTTGDDPLLKHRWPLRPIGDVVFLLDPVRTFELVGTAYPDGAKVARVIHDRYDDVVSLISESGLDDFYDYRPVIAAPGFNKRTQRRNSWSFAGVEDV